MRVYWVSYHDSADDVVNEFFSSLRSAEMRHAELTRIMKAEEKAAKEDEDWDSCTVKLVYETHVMKVDLTKEGVLRMLNTRFSRA